MAKVLNFLLQSCRKTNGFYLYLDVRSDAMRFGFGVEGPFTACLVKSILYLTKSSLGYAF